MFKGNDNIFAYDCYKILFYILSDSKAKEKKVWKCRIRK